MNERPEEFGLALPPRSPEVNPDSAPQPWGFWATLGWSLVIGAAFSIAQLIGMIVYLAFKGGRSFDLATIESDGLLLAVATLFGAPVAVGGTLFFAWLRKGIPVRQYLALQWPGWRTTLGWCAILLAFVAVFDAITVLVLKRPIVPDVMVEMYRNAGFLPVFCFAIIFAAPVAEEFIFRGFYFAGLLGQGTRAHKVNAVLNPAAVWAAIHLQYDLFGIGMIFLSGILLGCARLRTGSMPLCIVLHILMNAVATIECAISVR